MAGEKFENAVFPNDKQSTVTKTTNVEAFTARDVLRIHTPNQFYFLPFSLSNTLTRTRISVQMKFRLEGDTKHASTKAPILPCYDNLKLFSVGEWKKKKDSIIGIENRRKSRRRGDDGMVRVGGERKKDDKVSRETYSLTEKESGRERER